MSKSYLLEKFLKEKKHHIVESEETSVKFNINLPVSTYALFYLFWDYGWYAKAIDKNENGTVCTTRHPDKFFCNKEVYTGRTFASSRRAKMEVASHLDEYIKYTEPNAIDYESGKRKGAIVLMKLNDERNGWVDQEVLFEYKKGSLIDASPHV